jgi:hypothetical protein
VAIKIANFETPEELNAYIKKLKEENKERNRIIKYEKKRAQIDNLINLPLPTINLTESPVDIKLDENTGNTILILGCSKRGKSTLMMHIYDKYYKADRSYISTLFSGNPQLKVYKGDKNLLIGYGFNNDSAKYVQLQQYINVKTNNRYKFLNLFDDVVDSKYNIIIKKSILIYRNSNISSIICLQDAKDLEKKARGSINHTFVFGSNTTENAREVIELILRPYFIEVGVTDRDMMMQLYKKYTANHGFFYIDNINSKLTTGRLELSL